MEWNTSAVFFFTISLIKICNKKFRSLSIIELCLREQTEYNLKPPKHHTAITAVCFKYKGYLYSSPDKLY